MSQEISRKEVVQAGGVVGGARMVTLCRSVRAVATGYAFIIPALIVYVFFIVYPLCASFYYSLTSWDGAKPVKEFVGLANYRALIVDPLLWEALYHNLIWIILGTITPILIGLVLAVLLWSGVRGRVVFRTIYFLPVVLSQVVVGIIWSWMYYPLYGVVNKVLKGVGLDFLARAWLADPTWALPSIIVAAIGPMLASVLSSSWPVCRILT